MVLPITESVVDPGEGPGGTGSPLCLDQRGRKGRKKIFWGETGPLLISRSGFASGNKQN